MPDLETLASMYNTEYADEEWTDDQRSYDDWVVEQLTNLPPGRFVDFGCGRGRLLERVRDLGREVAGIEYDPAVAGDVSARLGVPVVTPDEAPSLGRFAVVHLGDVLEHLTDVSSGLEAALALLDPGAVVLAQGPLEGNANVFTLAVRLAGLLRQSPATVPPFHVLLATSRGQRRLFERAGLRTSTFVVEEVAWPAPARLDLDDRRGAALWALRRLSQLVTGLLGGRTGNRYRYVGTTAR
jgi:SAM-dependent methyltransferase